MISAFERITIDVADLEAALAEYSLLLGPFVTDNDTARLNLGNVGIELRHRPQSRSNHIASLSVYDESQHESGQVEARGLSIGIVGRDHGLKRGDITPTGLAAVDHLVVQTGNADDCIQLFGEGGMGMRLALDQEVSEWGGRMVFFRMGKMTLEIIQNLQQPVARDHFWGITFLCDDLDRTLAILKERGVEHSAPRDGRKPGTRVATVKSHCLGLPTLLADATNRAGINSCTKRWLNSLKSLNYATAKTQETPLWNASSNA